MKNMHPFFDLGGEIDLSRGSNRRVSLENVEPLFNMGFGKRDLKRGKALEDLRYILKNNRFLRTSIRPDHSDPRGETHSKMRGSNDLTRMIHYSVSSKQVTLSEEGQKEPWLSQVVCDWNGKTLAPVHVTETGVALFRWSVYAATSPCFRVITVKTIDGRNDAVLLSINSVEAMDQHPKIKCQQNCWHQTLDRERLLRGDISVDRFLKTRLAEMISDGEKLKVFEAAIMAAIRNFRGMNVKFYTVDEKVEKKAAPTPKSEAASAPAESPVPAANAKTDTTDKPADTTAKQRPVEKKGIAFYAMKKFGLSIKKFENLNPDADAMIAALGAEMERNGGKFNQAFDSLYPTIETLPKKADTTPDPAAIDKPAPTNASDTTEAPTFAPAASAPADVPARPSGKPADENQRKQVDALKRKLSNHLGFDGKHFGNENALAKSIVEELEKGADEEQLFAALPKTLPEALASRSIQPVNMEHRPPQRTPQSVPFPDIEDGDGQDYFARALQGALRFPNSFWAQLNAQDGEGIRIIRHIAEWARQETAGEKYKGDFGLFLTGLKDLGLPQICEWFGLTLPESTESAPAETPGPKAANSAPPQPELNPQGGGAIADAFDTFAAAQKLEQEKRVGLSLPAWLEPARYLSGVSLKELKAAKRHGEKSKQGKNILALLAGTSSGNGTPAPPTALPAESPATGESAPSGD